VFRGDKQKDRTVLISASGTPCCSRSFLSCFRKEGVIGRIRIISQALIGVTVVAGSVATFGTAAWAATIPVACSENALVAAVNLANSTSARDTLVLASGCTYSMTSSQDGLANALPVITTPIEMIGPATITRDSPLSFRIAEVSTTGDLILTTAVAFTNGSVVGDGGAILNRGAVTLTGSSLSGNSATLNGGGLANVDTPSGTAPAATFTRSPVSDNAAMLSGGGIYNGLRGTLTTTGVSGSPMFITGNTAEVSGGGIAANNSNATTLTQTAVTTNHATMSAGGVSRQGGTMITTSSPISANTINNCVGSAPAVPNCTG
jgi:predicted outer membrane repeat protein